MIEPGAGEVADRRRQAGERLGSWCLHLVQQSGDLAATVDRYYPFLQAGFPWICASPDVPLPEVRRYGDLLLPRMNLRGDWSAAVAGLELARGREGWPEARNWLAWFYELAARYGEAEAVAEEGLADAIRLDSTGARCEALNRRAKILRTRGEYRRALAVYAQSRELAEAAHETAMRAYILNGSGLTWWHLGELEKALACLREGWEIARGLDDPRQQGQILDNLGIVWTALGAYEEAEQHLEEALRREESIGDRREIGLLCGNLGEVQRYRGNRARALFLHERALQLAEELGNLYRIAKAKVRISALLADAEETADLERAARLAAEAAELGRDRQLHHFEITGRSHEAWALFRLGRQAAAATLSREAVRRLAEHEHFDGSREEILLHHFSILEAVAPDEARRAALAAGDVLAAAAGRLQDADLRRRFLEGIALHRAIRQTVERLGGEPA